MTIHSLQRKREALILFTLLDGAQSMLPGELTSEGMRG
jgi:hypothetical protein